MNADEVLTTGADLAEKVGSALAAEPAGMAFRIAAMALRTGAAAARKGRDPVVEISRLLSASDAVDSVHDDWDRAISDRFPPKSDPPPR